MDAIITISLKKIAISRMQDVQRGLTSREQAEQSIQRICKLSKSELTAHLTREYDRQTAEAFRYFGII